MTTKLLYVATLLYKACFINTKPPLPITHPPHIITHSAKTTPVIFPIHIATYTLLRDIFNQQPIPLHEIYTWSKKFPTAYPLLSSTDFIALQNASLQEGDTIIIKKPPLLFTPGSHLFFDVATSTHKYIRDPKNPTFFSCPLVAGKIIIYSWYQYYGDTPTIETHGIMVTKRK